MKYLGPPQSGSISNQTFSRNRYGQYTRARNGRGGTGSVAVTGAVALWQSASDEDRQSWSEGLIVVLARGLMIDHRPLSPFVLWMKMQLSYFSQTGSYGPTNFAGWNTFSSAVNWGVIDSFTPVWTLGLLKVSFTWPGSPGQGLFVLRSSGIITAGTMSPPGRGKWWKNVATVSWTPATVQPVDLTVFWAAAFGAVPLPGEWTAFEAASNLQPGLPGGSPLRLRIQA